MTLFEARKVRFPRRKDNRKYKEAARLLADGNVKEAIVLLREIIQQDPEHVNALTTLGVALLEIQGEARWEDPRTKEAFSLFDRAASIDSKDPVPLFNKAVSLRNLGRLREALEVFERVLEIEERLPLAILHMAEINYELENWDKAIELARLALIRDPGIGEALTWVPEAMRKAGYLDEEGNVILEKVPWNVNGRGKKVSKEASGEDTSNKTSS